MIDGITCNQCELRSASGEVGFFVCVCVVFLTALGSGKVALKKVVSKIFEGRMSLFFFGSALS